MKHTTITLVFPNTVTDTEAREMTQLIANQVRASVKETNEALGPDRTFPTEVRVGVAILRVEPRT